MLKLMEEKESIQVINDQTGCPTYAADLAQFILQLVTALPGLNVNPPRIFNYSNAGSTSWNGFAEAIKDMIKSDCKILSVTTAGYNARAKRPLYSVLDTTKVQELFHITIPGWKESLQKCLLL